MRPEKPNLKPERPNLRLERPGLRPERPDLRPEIPDLRPERLDLRPERMDLQPERLDLMPERLELRPEGPDEGGDAQSNKRMDEQTNESPPVFYRILSPSGPLPKREDTNFLGKLQGGLNATCVKFGNPADLKDLKK